MDQGERRRAVVGSGEVVAVWRAGAAEAMAEILEKAFESLSLVGSRRGNWGTGRDVLSSFMQCAYMSSADTRSSRSMMSSGTRRRCSHEGHWQRNAVRHSWSPARGWLRCSSSQDHLG
jgi:hypothetical protein